MHGVEQKRTEISIKRMKWGGHPGLILVKLISNSKLDLSPELQTSVFAILMEHLKGQHDTTV